jgi:hypothetical protein
LGESLGSCMVASVKTVPCSPSRKQQADRLVSALQSLYPAYPVRARQS